LSPSRPNGRRGRGSSKRLCVARPGRAIASAGTTGTKASIPPRRARCVPPRRPRRPRPEYRGAPDGDASHRSRGGVCAAVAWADERVAYPPAEPTAEERRGPAAKAGGEDKGAPAARAPSLPAAPQGDAQRGSRGFHPTAWKPPGRLSRSNRGCRFNPKRARFPPWVRCRGTVRPF
jgi:hypothetical protein